jgi:hypothetical protein
MNNLDDREYLDKKSKYPDRGGILLIKPCYRKGPNNGVASQQGQLGLVEESSPLRSGLMTIMRSIGYWPARYTAYQGFRSPWGADTNIESRLRTLDSIRSTESGFRQRKRRGRYI